MTVPSLRRSSLAAVLALLGCGSPAPSLTDEARAAVEREVQATVTSLMEAMNAHDADAVLAHYEEGPAFTYLGVTEMRVGHEAFARVVRAWHRANRDVSFDHEIVGIRALGPDAAVAVVRGSSSDGVALAWSRVLARDGQGRWRVVHEHESWPGAEPPSGPHPM